jgi:spore coat protein A
VTKAGTNLHKRLNPTLQPGQAEYYYPNDQSARMVWYHDHAHDLTRLNAYAGIASAYIIRDRFEGNLRNLGLPDFVEHGGREIPIIIQDKIFVGRNIATKDPSWPQRGGQSVVSAHLRAGPLGGGRPPPVGPASQPLDYP